MGALEIRVSVLCGILRIGSMQLCQNRITVTCRLSVQDLDLWWHLVILNTLYPESLRVATVKSYHARPKAENCLTFTCNMIGLKYL